MCTAEFERYEPDPQPFILLALIALVLALMAILSTPARAVDGLAIVAEHYDCVRIETEVDERRDWQLRRALFIRGDKVIAERSVRDEMLFTTHGNQFLLVWDDYGTAHRRIVFDHLVEVAVDPAPPGGQSDWWNMKIRMTDLRAPE